MVVMKKSVLAFVFLLMAGFCHAQEEEIVMVPDRPGNSWGAEVLPYSKITWENGFGFERDADGQHTLSLPSTIVRYGIFENVELRVGTDLLLQETEGQTTSLLGIAPLTIGTKIKCYEGEGILPSIGILAQVASPHVGSVHLLPSHLAPSLYLIFENSITDRMYVCYNAGAEWDGDTATPTTFLSLLLGFELTDELGTYAETFNYLHPEGNQYLTEFGFYFTPSNRLQLDIEADFDILHPKEYFSISGGISWMIN